MKRNEIIRHMITSHFHMYEEQCAKNPSQNLEVKFSHEKPNDVIVFKKIRYPRDFNPSKAEEMMVIVISSKRSYNVEKSIGTIIEITQTTISISFKIDCESVDMNWAKNDIVMLETIPNWNSVNLLNKAIAFFSSGKYFLPVLYNDFKCDLPNCKGSISRKKLENGIFNDNRLFSEDIADEIENLAISVSCETSELTFSSERLNKTQKKFVTEAMQSVAIKMIGPPGTGKTETLVEVITQFLRKGVKVLVCGPSNTSMDNIIERFLKSEHYKTFNTKFVRLGSELKGLVQYNLKFQADEIVQAKLKNYTLPRDPRALKKTISKLTATVKASLLSASDIVFSTLMSSLALNMNFGVCIVDEACQASQLECFMGIIKAKRFIIAGDPNQLCSPSTSLYEHLNIKTIMLDVQYRMPSYLFKFSNVNFYQDLVKSAVNENIDFFCKNNILFIDIKNSRCESRSKCSYKNEKESSIILKCITWFRNLGKTSIGMIAPYSGQVCNVKALVKQAYNIKSNPNAIVSAKYEVFKLPQSDCMLSIGTIDSFQGQEKEIIIVSLVRSNTEKTIGFMSEIKRMNVALTRCKKGLIVIGDSDTFSRNLFFNNFFNFVKSSGFFIDSKDLFTISQ